MFLSHPTASKKKIQKGQAFHRLWNPTTLFRQLHAAASIYEEIFTLGKLIVNIINHSCLYDSELPLYVAL
jgi:hypothetical protein